MEDRSTPRRVKLDPGLRADLAEVLRWHFPQGAVECDHEAKRDRVKCGCSLLNLGWHPSVGKSVESWVAHVLVSLEEM